MILLLASLAGCGEKAGADCGVACPEGTRRVEAQISETIVEGSFYLASESCEVVCEPTQPCLAPNIPVVTEDGGVHTYACEPLDGYATIPTPGEVDTSFGQWWREIPDPVTSELAVSAAGATLQDADGDGAEDLLTWSGSAFSLAISQGDGTFALVDTAPAEGDPPSALVEADLDGDGWLDWVGTGQLYGATVMIGWWRGAGGGLVETAPEPLAQATPPGYLTPRITPADLDDDGSADLVITNFSEAAQVVVLWGEGGGAVSPPQPLDLSGLPYNTNPLSPAAVGDFDGDGLLDLLLDKDQGCVFLQRGSRDFALATTRLLGDYSGIFGALDATGDGLDDVVAVGGYEGLCGDACLLVLASAGDGTFAAPTAQDVEDPPYASFVGPFDFDGDGPPDLAWSGSASVGFVSVSAGSAIGPFYRYLDVGVGPLAAGDVDGDGQDEAINLGSGASSSSITVVYP